MRMIQQFFVFCSTLLWDAVAIAQNTQTRGEGGLLSGNLFWILILVGVVVILIIAMSLRGRGHTHVEETSHHAPADHHHHHE